MCVKFVNSVTQQINKLIEWKCLCNSDICSAPLRLYISLGLSSNSLF